MNVDELCQWLKPKLDDEHWKVAEQVIRNQLVTGNNFLNTTIEQWMAVGLPLGVADSLAQIVQGVLGSGAPVVGYSLLSTLNKSFMKKCETRPIVASDDGKLLAVYCSDFLINQKMKEGFHQYCFLRGEAK
jgi:hypothetical protein